MPSRAMSLPIAEGNSATHDRAFDAVPGHRREALYLRELDAVRSRASDDRLGKGVLGMLLECRGEREDLPLLMALEQHDVGHFWLAVRERARLVEDDCGACRRSRAHLRS